MKKWNTTTASKECANSTKGHGDPVAFDYLPGFWVPCLGGFSVGRRAARWNFVAFAACFGNADGNRLLAALHRGAPAGLQLTMLEFVHHLADFV